MPRRVSSRTAARRAPASPTRAGEAPLVVAAEDVARPRLPPRRQAGLDRLDVRAQAGGSPRRSEEAEVERQVQLVAVAEVARPLREVVAEVDLAEERPHRSATARRRKVVDEAPERAEVGVDVRVRAVVDVPLPVVRGDRLVSGIGVRARAGCRAGPGPWRCGPPCRFGSRRRRGASRSGASRGAPRGGPARASSCPAARGGTSAGRTARSRRPTSTRVLRRRRASCSAARAGDPFPARCRASHRATRTSCVWGCRGSGGSPGTTGAGPTSGSAPSPRRRAGRARGRGRRGGRTPRGRRRAGRRRSSRPRRSLRPSSGMGRTG